MCAVLESQPLILVCIIIFVDGSIQIYAICIMRLACIDQFQGKKSYQRLLIYFHNEKVYIRYKCMLIYVPLMKIVLIFTHVA